MHGRHTLVLNNDWTPISVMPPSAIDWQRAITAVFLEQVRPIHFYENWQIHSPSMVIAVPSVVVSVGSFVNVKRQVSHSYSNAFLRDDFTCQYCGARDISPTADHVLPRSRGGSDLLTNITTACTRCNNGKGNKIIKPKKMPHMPTYYELLRKARNMPVTVPHASWIDYIGWNDTMIKVVEPRGMPGYGTKLS